MLLELKNKAGEVVKTVDTSEFDSIAEMRVESFRSGLASIQPSFIKSVAEMKNTVALIKEDTQIVCTDGEYVVECNGKDFHDLIDLYKRIKVTNRPQKGRGQGSGTKKGISEL